jgi:hypothetical protein
MMALIFAIIMIGCTFESPGSGTIYANVNFYSQENYYYCGPAVIQMIADWSGAHFTQDQLFIALNGQVGYGITVDQLTQGLRTFTALGDAYTDYAPYTDNNYWARQISSVSNKTPVAAVTEANTHSVVLYGGNYRTDSTSTGNVYHWIDVYVHDPGRGGGINYTAGPWQTKNCDYLGTYCVQSISYSAALEGPKTLADYNPVVVVEGGGDGGPGHGPYDY